MIEHNAGRDSEPFVHRALAGSSKNFNDALLCSCMRA